MRNETPSPWAHDSTTLGLAQRKAGLAPQPAKTFDASIAMRNLEQLKAAQERAAQQQPCFRLVDGAWVQF